MHRLAAILILLALAGCANLRQSAHLATATDAATTAIGVTSGVAAEVNPLVHSPAAFVGLILARVIGTEYVETLPEPVRTEALSALNAVWWGYGASNVAVLLLASNPAGIAAGLVTGVAWWVGTAERREFAQICAHERRTKPALVCAYTPA